MPEKSPRRVGLKPTTLQDTLFLAEIRTLNYVTVIVLSPDATERYLANPIAYCEAKVLRSHRPEVPERHRIVGLQVRRYQKDQTFLDRPDTLGGVGEVEG